MRTIDFKVWLVMLFLCTAVPRAAENGLYEREVICINVNQKQGYTAVMDGNKAIYYIQWTDGWTDGDFGTIVYTADRTVVSAESKAHAWRYDNNGTFTNVSYPWWYTGNRPETVKTRVVR